MGNSALARHRPTKGFRITLLDTLEASMNGTVGTGIGLAQSGGASAVEMVVVGSSFGSGRPIDTPVTVTTRAAGRVSSRRNLLYCDPEPPLKCSTLVYGVSCVMRHASCPNASPSSKAVSRTTLKPCNFVFICRYFPLFPARVLAKRFLQPNGGRLGTPMFHRTLVGFAARVLWTGTSKSPSPMPTSTSHQVISEIVQVSTSG